MCAIRRGTNSNIVITFFNYLKYNDMTREDVVNSYDYKVAKASVDYSQKYAKDDELQGIVMDTFEDAAKFGYNLAIGKACDYLERALPLRPDDRDEFIEQFKETMKGDEL